MFANAAEEKFAFTDNGKKALFSELINELRCPKCQNQNIADSDAMIAQDLQRKVYQLVQEGKSKDEVLAYMIQRYGDFVHYKPPVTVATIWLWLLPLIVILLAILGMRRHAKGNTSIDPEKLKQAEALLQSPPKQEDN
jgi:cytochrome c-type biogenesis protein CcmH